MCYKLHWHKGQQGLLSLRTVGKKSISVLILECILRDVFKDKVRCSLVFGRTSLSLIPSMSHVIPFTVCFIWRSVPPSGTLCPFLCSGWNDEQSVEQNFVVNQGVRHSVSCPHGQPPQPACSLSALLAWESSLQGWDREKWSKSFCVQTVILMRIENRKTRRPEVWTQTGARNGLVPRGASGEQCGYGPPLQITTCLPFTWNNSTTMIRLFWCCSHCLQSQELVFPWAFPTLWCLLCSALALWKKHCGPMISDHCYNAVENYTLSQAFIPVDLYT